MKELIKFDISEKNYSYNSTLVVVSVDEAVEIIRRKHRPREDVVELVNHCLKNTY